MIGLTRGLITAVGWFVNSFLSRQAARRLAQHEAALRRLRVQIEELYGPLSGLIQQSASVYGVATSVLPATAGKFDMGKFSDADWNAWRYLCERYFLPPNREISSLVAVRGHEVD